MSVPVDLAVLGKQVGEHGPLAYVVTVGEDGRPHVVSARVEATADGLVAPCGKTTGANVERSRIVTVLWPSPPGADHCLIVDGTATVADGLVAVAPTRAVLHRVAGEGPTCVPVG